MSAHFCVHPIISERKGLLNDDYSWRSGFVFHIYIHVTTQMRLLSETKEQQQRQQNMTKNKVKRNQLKSDIYACLYNFGYLCSCNILFGAI